MIDGATETLRWVKNRITHASAFMKIVYVLLLGLVFIVAVIFIPFFKEVSEHFSHAHPFVQSFFLVFLFAGTIASVLFSYERSRRVEQLKEENARLDLELKELAKNLKAAQVANKEAESRWDALVEVESRQEIWKRPCMPSNPAFVPMEQRGTKTRFISMLNLKGGVGKTTITACLAACLALMDKPLRVLVVDLDFQGSLTDHTVDPQLKELQKCNGNSTERLLDPEFETASLNQLFTPMFRVPSVKVVIATDKLHSVDSRLQAEFFVKPDREVRFLFLSKMHCQPFFHQFDLVIFDCPPRLTTSVVNALICSDFVLIPTKLDQDSINSVPRSIIWLDALAGVSAQLIGVVANDVSLWRGRLTQGDQNSYDYLCSVVAQLRAGNRGYVFESTIKSDTGIPPSVQGLVASVEEGNRAFFQEFVRELRRRINL